MSAGRVLVARATSRAAWTRRLVAVARAVDDVIAWKLDLEQRWEANDRRRRRQRRHRRRQRAATRRAWVARWRHTTRVRSGLEALDHRGNP